MKNIRSVSLNSLLLLGILFLALFLRVWGISFGLPYLYHADEPIVVNHALAYGAGDLNPHFFNIPPLTSYLLFAVYIVYFLIGYFFQIFSSVQDFEFLFYTNPSSFYLLARLLFGAVLGTISVFCYYQEIARIFGQTKALVASFLFSIAFLHVRESHYIYADIPLVFVSLLALFHFTRLKTDSLRYDAISGAFIGVATAFKYNGFFLFVPYLVSLRLTRRRSNPLGIMIAFLTSVLIFFALNLYSLLDASFFLSELKEEGMAHGIGPGLVFLLFAIPEAVGWPIFLYALIWIMGVIWKKDSRLWPMASWLILYSIVIAFKGQPYGRYILPLVPWLVFAAADLTDLLSACFPRIRSILITLSLLILSLPNLCKSTRFDWLMSQKDVRSLSKQWIENHIPEGSKVAFDNQFYMPRLNYSQEQLIAKKMRSFDFSSFSKKKMRRLDFAIEHLNRPFYELYFLKDEPHDLDPFLFSGPNMPYDLKALKEKGIRYVVMGNFHPGFHRDFFQRLEKEGKLIASFNPYKTFRIWPLRHPLTGGPFTTQDLNERVRNGQPLRVFEI